MIGQFVRQQIGLVNHVFDVLLEDVVFFKSTFYYELPDIVSFRRNHQQSLAKSSLGNLPEQLFELHIISKPFGSQFCQVKCLNILQEHLPPKNTKLPITRNCFQQKM